MTEADHGVYDVSNRLGVSSKSYITGLRLMGHSQRRPKLLGLNKMKSDASRPVYWMKIRAQVTLSSFLRSI